LQRFAIFSLIGVLIAVVINEVSFLFLKSDAGRAPGRIELVIPPGTAEKIARGEAETTIPDDLVLVTGDVLIVKNEDSVTHTLGPLFIPAGSSASLNLDQVENLAMSCSFQPGQYMGLNVKEPVDWGTRVFALFLSGVPLGLLLALYSFLVWPLKASNSTSQSQANG
jgi:hypothetical protein